MLDEMFDRLIGAVEANTAALLGKAAPGKPAAGTKPTDGKPVVEKITAEMVKAAVVAVKDKHNKAAALKIIKEAGGCAELAAIKPARYPAVMAACAELMDETPEAPVDDDDNL